MKRLVLLFLCLLVAVGAFAGEKGPRFDIEGGAALSLYSTYVSVTPEIMYDMGLLAVGVGVKNYFGIPFHDIYTAPYALVELGWFYLGAGASFMIKAPDPATSENGFAVPEADEDNGFIPFLTAGIAPALIPVGPGKLGFNIAADFLATATPVELVDDSGSVIGDVFGTLLVTAIMSIFNSFKLGATVFYTIAL